MIYISKYVNLYVTIYSAATLKQYVTDTRNLINVLSYR